MLTAYEQYAAQTFDEAGIEVLLVGDSASNNVYANETSLPVTVDELIPLARAVTRSVRRALVVTDPGVAGTGHPDRVADLVRARGIEAVVFDGVHVEPTDASLVTTRVPICEEWSTCVPPQSSRLHGPPISTTRTLLSSYVSPKSATAPQSFAWRSDMYCAETARSARRALFETSSISLT